MTMTVIPPLITTISRDFKIDYASFGGYVTTTQFLSFAAASIFGGWLSHKFGLSNRSLIITGIFLMAFVMASASTFGSFKYFIFWAIFIGISGGLVETFNSIMLCRIGGPASSKMMNLAQIFFCLGAIVTPFVIARMLNYGMPWHLSFIFFAAIIFIIGICFTWYTRDIVEPQIEVSVSATTAKSVGLLNDPLFYFLCGTMFLYVAIECAAGVWLATYFEKHLSVPVKSAAWRLSIFWLGLLVGRMVILFLKARWTLWPAMIVAGIGMMAGNFLLSFKWEPFAATVIVFIGGLFAGPIWPVVVSLSQKLRNSSMFTSCVISAGAMGAATGPFLSSRLIDRFGMNYLFPVLACFGLLLIIFVVMARRYR